MQLLFVAHFLTFVLDWSRWGEIHRTREELSEFALWRVDAQSPPLNACRRRYEMNRFPTAMLAVLSAIVLGLTIPSAQADDDEEAENVSASFGFGLNTDTRGNAPNW